MSSAVEGAWYVLIEEAPMDDGTPRMQLGDGHITGTGVANGRYTVDGEELRVTLDTGEHLVLTPRGEGVLSGNMTSPVAGFDDLVQPIALIRGIADHNADADQP